MALAILKSYVRCWKKGRNINMKVNVIELYVIKSWWKIKFNKRKASACLFVCFLFIKPALTNLYIIIIDCCNGVASQENNKVWPRHCRLIIVFFFKTIMNSYKVSFQEHRTSFFQIFFCSNIAASKTSFWARPLKADHSKLNACNVCSLEALWKFFWLRSWRNACRCWLGLENKTKF